MIPARLAEESDRSAVLAEVAPINLSVDPGSSGQQGAFGAPGMAAVAQLQPAPREGSRRITWFTRVAIVPATAAASPSPSHTRKGRLGQRGSDGRLYFVVLLWQESGAPSTSTPS